MLRHIEISIVEGDALEARGDVLALKHADGLYGLDALVCRELEAHGVDVRGRLPERGKTLMIESQGQLSVHSVLFLGVGDLYQFKYRGIREFATSVLAVLAQEAPKTRELVVTVHGANYGLDETEALESEVAGFVDGISVGECPAALERIRIVEHSPGRATRMAVVLGGLLPQGRIPLGQSEKLEEIGSRAISRLRGVGYDSDAKPHVFVAMPFAEEMTDVYHFGIAGAVNAAGFLCEQADLSTFTGDVLAWVKRRIDSASIVIADLTGANPNVYLEVGYAWGMDRPTILLLRHGEKLRFDVQGQRCLIYKNIRHLEKMLAKELNGLDVSE